MSYTPFTIFINKRSNGVKWSGYDIKNNHHHKAMTRMTEAGNSTESQTALNIPLAIHIIQKYTGKDFVKTTNVIV